MTSYYAGFRVYVYIMVTKTAPVIRLRREILHILFLNDHMIVIEHTKTPHRAAPTENIVQFRKITTIQRHLITTYRVSHNICYLFRAHLFSDVIILGNVPLRTPKSFVYFVVRNSWTTKSVSFHCFLTNFLNFCVNLRLGQGCRRSENFRKRHGVDVQVCQFSPKNQAF